MPVSWAANRSNSGSLLLGHKGLSITARQPQGNHQHNRNLIPCHPGLGWHPDRLSIITNMHNKTIFKWAIKIRACVNSFDRDQVFTIVTALVIWKQERTAFLTAADDLSAWNEVNATEYLQSCWTTPSVALDQYVAFKSPSEVYILHAILYCECLCDHFFFTLKRINLYKPIVGQIICLWLNRTLMVTYCTMKFGLYFTNVSQSHGQGH